MKTPFVVAGLLLSASVAQARPMPTLDLDALLFWSNSVVEGPLTAVKTQNYETSAAIRVEKTWTGISLTGQTVQVGDLSLYTKGQPWRSLMHIKRHKVKGKIVETAVNPPFQPERDLKPLEAGDRVIFFLDKSSKHISPARNTAWNAISSGVYMVRPIGISGFTQMSNPGGYNEVQGTTRAHFNATFAASLQRVKDLKVHLQQPPRKQDAAYFQNWATRRQKMLAHSQWYRGDVITQVVDERLKKIAELSNAPHQTP